MIEPTALPATRARAARRRAAPTLTPLLALIGLTTAAPALRAQQPDATAPLPRYRRAFEPSVSVMLGASSYGERLSRAQGDFRYRPGSSFLVALWADRPLTRRTGLVAGLAVAPISGQVEDQPPPADASVSYERLALATADLGIAGRLKPSAPVFFMLGGGVLLTTKGVSNILPNERLVEPHADFTIGMDGKRRQRWGWRVLYVNRWAFPRGVGASGFESPTTAHDWNVQVGARRMLGDLAALAGER